MEFRKASVVVQEIQLFQLNNDAVWSLNEFVQHQNDAYSEYREIIQDFYNQVSDSIRKTLLKVIFGIKLILKVSFL